MTRLLQRAPGFSRKKQGRTRASSTGGLDMSPLRPPFSSLLSPHRARSETRRLLRQALGSGQHGPGPCAGKSLEGRVDSQWVPAAAPRRVNHRPRESPIAGMAIGRAALPTTARRPSGRPAEPPPLLSSSAVLRPAYGRRFPQARSPTA